MKKKILVGIAILAIAAVAAFNVNFNSQSNDLSNVSLANVEALAYESSTVYPCPATGGVCVVMVGNTGLVVEGWHAP